MKRAFLVILPALILVAGSGLAQTIPTTMNYQGQLADATGTLLTNRDYTLTFNIYSADAVGVRIWGPQIFDGPVTPGHSPKVPLVGGRFNVVLGPIDTVGRQLYTNLYNNADYYLEITVETNSPIAPRQKILSAPFALRAANSDQLAGFGWNTLFENGNPAVDKILGSKLKDGSVTNGQIADNAVTSAKIADGTISAADIGPGAVTSSKIGPGAVGSSQIGLPLALSVNTATYALSVENLSGFTMFCGNKNSTAWTLEIQNGNPYDGANAAYFCRRSTGDAAAIVGRLTKSSGAFKIDHPLDPANKYLYHSFVESPDMKNIYDGIANINDHGEALVTLPEWFEALNGDFRYQLTAIGAPGPNLFIAEEISNNRFKIAGGHPGMKVSWQVTGIRRDAFALSHRIPTEEDKPAEEKGLFLSPEEHGQPKEKSVTRVWNVKGTSVEK